MPFCKNCGGKIKAFMKKVDDVLRNNISTALYITTMLKKFLGSDVAIIITALIPGDLDDRIREKALVALRLACIDLGILEKEKAITNSSAALTQDDLLKLISAIQDQKKAGADSYLIKLASLITKYLDSRYEQHQYDAATQIMYSLNK